MHPQYCHIEFCFYKISTVQFHLKHHICTFIQNFVSVVKILILTGTHLIHTKFYHTFWGWILLNLTVCLSKILEDSSPLSEKHYAVHKTWCPISSQNYINITYLSKSHSILYMFVPETKVDFIFWDNLQAIFMYTYMHQFLTIKTFIRSLIWDLFYHSTDTNYVCTGTIMKYTAIKLTFCLFMSMFT